MVLPILPIRKTRPFVGFVGTLLGHIPLYMGDPYSGDKMVTIIANSSHARVIIQTYVRAWRNIARAGVERATKVIKAIPSLRPSTECGSRGEEDAVDTGWFSASQSSPRFARRVRRVATHTGWAATRKIARFRANARRIFLFRRQVEQAQEAE